MADGRELLERLPKRKQKPAAAPPSAPPGTLIVAHERAPGERFLGRSREALYRLLTDDFRRSCASTSSPMPTPHAQLPGIAPDA